MIFFPFLSCLAYPALQNVNKDYEIFLYLHNFVAKSDQKPKTKNGMNETLKYILGITIEMTTKIRLTHTCPWWIKIPRFEVTGTLAGWIRIPVLDIELTRIPVSDIGGGWGECAIFPILSLLGTVCLLSGRRPQKVFPKFGNIFHVYSYTVPIDRILSVKNARAWVSMDFT